MVDELVFVLPSTGGDPMTLVRRAAASAGLEPVRRGRWLAALAVLLERHHRACGDTADLDEAVAAGRAAVEVLPAADEARAAAVSALAGALALRFRLRGRLTDLGEALALCEPARPLGDGGTGPAGTRGMAVLLAWARFHVSGVTSSGIPGPIRRRGEDLSGIRLRGQRLRYADLSDADLTDADLTDADLTGANLAGARLAGARLVGAVLNSTVLCGADLTGAWLPGTDLRTAHLAGAVLRRTMLLGSALPPEAVHERTALEGGAAWHTTVAALPVRRRRRSRVAGYFRDARAWLPPVVAADAGVADLVATVDAAGVVGLWDATARVPLRWIDDVRRREDWNAEDVAKARTDIWDTGDGGHAEHTVVLSPDGTTVARIASVVWSTYACLEHSLKVWLFDTVSGRPIGWHSCAESEEPEEDDPPRRVSTAFSPDGRQLAIAGSYNDIEVVLVPAASPPESLDEDCVPAVTVVWRGTHPEWEVVDGPLRYSPDGRRLAVAGRPFASHQDTAAVWELDSRTGAELFHAEAGGGHVLALSYLPDGRLAAVSGGAGCWFGRLWRTGEHESSATTESLSMTEPIACAAFAPDGGSVALAALDGAVEVRGLPSWRRRWRSPAGPAVTELRFSPDGKALAGTGTNLGTGTRLSAGYGIGTGIANGTRVWDTASGAERPRLTQTALAFTANGRCLITAGEPATLVDARSGASAGTLDPEPADADRWRLSGLCLFGTGAVADDPPGQPESEHGAGPACSLRQESLLLVGQWTFIPEAPRWRPGGSSAGRMKIYEDACVAWSADGRLLAVHWRDQVFLWPLDGLDTDPRVAPPPDPTATPDSGDDRYTVSYQDEGDEEGGGEDSADDPDDVDEICAVAFAPGDAFVTATHESGAVRFWRVTDGRPAGPGFDGAVVTAFSPDGRLLAGGGEDGVLRLWHMMGTPGPETRHAHDGSVRQLAFAPDGTLLATGGDDGLVRLWDPETLAPVGAPLPSSGGAVAFLPADGTLLTGDADGRVQRWDARTGEPQGPPFGDRPTTGPLLGGYQGRRGNTTLVEAITVSPDGRIVATRHDNNGVGLWDPVSHASLVPEGIMLAGTVAFAPGSGLVFIGGHLYHVDGPR